MSLILVALLSLVGLTISVDPIAHVFLVAGQSNSEGFNSDGFTDEDVTFPNLWQLDCCANGQTLPIDQCKFSSAKDPLHHQCDYGFINGTTVGFGMSFARAYRDDVPETDVVILVPAGIGGTGFFDGTWKPYTGGGFKAAVSKLTQAVNLVKQQGQYEPRFQGIVWQQGTHDAGDNVWGSIANTTLYLFNDMIPLINAFRDTEVLPFSSPQLPFLCGNIMKHWAENPAHPGRWGVYTALAVLDQLVPYTACAPSYGLVGDPGYPAGADNELVHWTAASQRILGKRYHAAYNLAKVNIPIDQE